MAHLQMVPGEFLGQKYFPGCVVFRTGNLTETKPCVFNRVSSGTSLFLPDCGNAVCSDAHDGVAEVFIIVRR
jgi:hypothetical protein